MAKPSDLAGQKFNMLSAIEVVGSNKHRKKIWRCICDCGNEALVISSELKNGHTKSCGCLQKIVTTKHGLYRTYPKEYQCWVDMKTRCNNPNNPSYEDYGGRGIKICTRWEDFGNFFADMGKRPSKKHSIDRIDNNKGYSPENCRWTIQKIQNINRRKRTGVTSKYVGVCWIQRDKVWRSAIRIEGKQTYLGTFLSEKEAALAYDKKAREIGYEEGWLNFPKEVDIGTSCL